MKVQVSHRLDEGLLTWATEYAETRSSSRAVVIEEALRHFRDLTSGGVPDLPERPRVVPASAEQIVAEGPHENVMRARQRRLAKEMGWA